MPERMARDRLLLGLLLVSLVLAYVSPYLRWLGQTPVAVACDYLAAITTAAAVVLAFVNVLNGPTDHSGCERRS